MFVFFIVVIVVIIVFFVGAVEVVMGFIINNFNFYVGSGCEFLCLECVLNNVCVEVFGCLCSYDWCDVVYCGERGWIDGNGLVFRDRGRRIIVRDYGPRYSLPMVSFNFRNYWDTHYRTHRFYRDRTRFENAFRDEDRDRIPNAVDRDRDGVCNRYDRRFDNPWRD